MRSGRVGRDCLNSYQSGYWGVVENDCQRGVISNDFEK